MEEQAKLEERLNVLRIEFTVLVGDVKRLTDHEREDRPKHAKWYEEFSLRLIELGKMRLESSNGRLTALEGRPVIVQLTEKELRALFDDWGKAWAEALAGRLSLKLILSVAGTVSAVVTAVLIAAILAYFRFRGG